MKREIELKRRLRSLETLSEAVGAMKNLSAHHFREARAGVPPAREYREGVEGILSCSGAQLAAGPGPAGLLVVGGELGLCGAYNSDLVEAAARARAELGEGPTVCVGHRVAALLARRGMSPDAVYAGPTSVRGITDLLLKVAEDLLTRYVARGLSAFHIVSSRFGGVGVARPERVRLLPIAPRAATPGKPIRYVARDELATAAVREFLYILLYDLLLDALASEHGARLAATQSAERWLDDRTTTLQRRLAAARREASTQEMIEIATGVRARERREPRPGSIRQVP